MLTILIGGKSEVVCDSLRAILEALPETSFLCLTDGIKLRSAVSVNPDVIVISTPLSDEFGLDLAADLHDSCKKPLIVLAKSDLADEVERKLKFTGAFVIGRPFPHSSLVQAVRFAAVAGENMQRLEQENQRLTRELEDVKVMNRAKLCLMQYLKLSEEQAHRHIQQAAMNTRRTQRQVAEDILKTYTA